MKERKRLSEIVRDVVEVTAEGGTTIISDLLLDGTIGQIAPGLVSIKMSYRQKKFEERMLLALKELSSRYEKLEAYLKGVNGEEYEFIKNKVFPLFFDYAIEATQDEKIKLFANGVEYITRCKLTEEDIVITYFDVLKELTLNELHFLLEKYTWEYTSEDQITLNVDNLRFPVTKEEKLNYEQLEGYQMYVDRRLFRMGLIGYAEAKSYIPKTYEDIGNPPNYDLTTYELSDFGRNFVTFFKNM